MSDTTRPEGKLHMVSLLMAPVAVRSGPGTDTEVSSGIVNYCLHPTRSDIER